MLTPATKPARRGCGCGGSCDSCSASSIGAGRPLAADVRRTMEPLFDFDFGRVRVHDGAAAHDSAVAAGARAYTFGNHVVFGRDEFRPGTQQGRSLLAHELAHVVQQAGNTPASAAGLRVTHPGDSAERAADAAAHAVDSGTAAPRLAAAPPAIARVVRPYIKQIDVNLSAPESATLTWDGTPPAGAPGLDSFTVSTGKGYSNPEDEPGACTRDCCSGADVQCAAPFNRPGAVGSCCTPIGTNFWTGLPLTQHNGWNWWTPVMPIYGQRGIALHQHTEVTGEAIGHGCIRMDEDNAHRIYLYSRRENTKVTIAGAAHVACPPNRQCGGAATGANDVQSSGDQLAAAPLTRPDEEDPGSAAAPAEAPSSGATEEAAV